MNSLIGIIPGDHPVIGAVLMFLAFAVFCLTLAPVIFQGHKHTDTPKQTGDGTKHIHA